MSLFIIVVKQIKKNMNLQTYKKFLFNNYELVEKYRQTCIQRVLFNCIDIPTRNLVLYHGTPHADEILQQGFRIDKFSGTQPMGVGVYLTPDKRLAEYFGNKILQVHVKLREALDFSADALIGFREIRDEFFDRIVTIIDKNRLMYIGDKKGAILNEEASLVQSNLFTDLLKDGGYDSIHSFTDTAGGINGRDMNQWVVMNKRLIQKIEPCSN